MSEILEPEGKDEKGDGIYQICPNPPFDEESVNQQAALQKVDAGIYQDDDGIEGECPPGKHYVADQIRQRRRHDEKRQQDATEYDEAFARHNDTIVTQK
jgi:hypothetical protein